MRILVFLLCLLSVSAFGQGLAVRSLNGAATNLNVKGLGAQAALTVNTNNLVVTNGNVGFGTNGPTSPIHLRPVTSGQSYLRVDDTNGTPRFQVGVYPGVASLGAIWLGDVTPSAANMIAAGDGTTTYFLGGSDIIWQTLGASRWAMNSSGHFLAATDNTYDIGASGANRPRSIYAATHLIGGGDVTAGGGVKVGGGFVEMKGPGDGILTLYNSSNTDFNRLQFGGTTASFPGIKRVGAGLALIGADGVGSGSNNLVVAGSVITTNGLASFATNIIASINEAGYTNSPTVPGTGTGLNMNVHVVGTSGTIVFYNRSGLNGQVVCGTPLWTNTTAIPIGMVIPVPVNCGIQIVSGVGVTMQAYAQ